MSHCSGSRRSGRDVVGWAKRKRAHDLVMSEKTRGHGASAPLPTLRELRLEPHLRLLHPAPFRDEQRHRLGRLLQRLQIDKLVEAVHLAAAGAETQARDAVVEAVKAGVGQRGEDEILDLPAIDLVEGLAE